MTDEEKNEAIKAKKLDYTLVPAVFLKGTATALGHGAQKYSRRGYLRNEDYDVHAWRALLRHVMAIQGGEMIDEEFGLHHIAHIAANCAMIMHYWSENGNSPNWPEPDGTNE